MSFGYSMGDFVVVGQLAWKIYRACKDAPEGFKNIAQEVLSLHVVLKELEETHSDANLSATQQSRLGVVGDGCRAVLKDLQELVNRYNSLGTNTKRTWDRLAWGSDNIAELRSRLISNTGLLTAFLNTSQVIVQKKLDMLLQEFRDGKREGSVISTQTVDSLSPDEKQAWRAIRKELEEIGISVAAFDANKEFIVNWLKTAIVTRAFEEETAEEDELSRLLSEHVSSQSFEREGHDGTVLYQPSRDVGNDPNLTSTSAGLQALKISLGPRRQSRRPPRTFALANWLFRYNENLSKATESGNEAKVRQALEKGADVNTKNARGLTPLFLAVSTGNEALLRLLLENGADVHIQNADGSTALMYSKTEAMISILLEHGANIHEKDNDGSTALHRGVMYGRETVVQLLLVYGAKIDKKNKYGDTALHWAARFAHETVVQLLLKHRANVNEKNEHGSTALHWAARHAPKRVVQLLLKHGANINEKNERGRTALHWAAGFAHETVVQLLLKHEANINEKNEHGNTALHWAVRQAPERVVQLLLDYGAKVDEKNDYGDTALHWAARFAHETVVQLLLKHRANVNEKNEHGSTALHRAARHAPERVVQLLLSHGANINEKNKMGNTSLREAKDWHRLEVGKVLRDAGGSY